MSIKLPKIVVFVILGCMFATGYQVQAQQDSQFTQYMYNTVAVNPAYAGSRGSLTTLAVYRSQWVGLEGAPTTLNFTAHSPVGLRGVGLGLAFTSDRIGPSTESIVAVDFSYTLDMSRDVKLAFGIKGGLSIFDINPSKLNIYDPSTFNLAQQSSSSPVIGVGFYLYSHNWYAGISSPNFLSTKYYDDVQATTATENTHLYFIGGYVHEVNPKLKLKPALLLKAINGAPLAIDASVNALFHNRLTLGLAYRVDAAASLLAGFQVDDNIMVGYAYDYDTTPLGSYNNGSHEFFLRFELATRQRARVNPRFF